MLAMSQRVCVPDDECEEPRPFAELDSATQAKALEANRDFDIDGHDWWKYTYEDAARLGECIGITIARRYERSRQTDQFIDQGPDIQFSGFWSQGDGASFTGSYEPKADALSALAAAAPKDEELKRIAEALTLLQTTLKLKHDCVAGGTIRTSGRHSHSSTMDFELDADFQDGDLGSDGDAVHSELLQLMRAFADWIYSSLEGEYNYLTSGEHLTEVFTQSDYLFDADGRMI